MKNPTRPNNREVRLGEDEFIVSKTDTRGIMTYANRTFLRTSGYAEGELLGKQHNIVRHPEMPRGTFRLMWQTLDRGEEFFAYIKNLCKDGSFYWVLANVTPDRDARGEVVGYYSVRRKPHDHAIQTMEPLYRKMVEIEQSAGAKAGPARSIEYLEEFYRSRQMSYEELVLSLDSDAPTITHGQQETTPWTTP